MYFPIAVRKHWPRKPIEETVYLELQLKRDEFVMAGRHGNKQAAWRPEQETEGSFLDHWL